MGYSGQYPVEIHFMYIKYTEKFESILYAVLYSNLTGYFLFSEKENIHLPSNAKIIDIDKINWQEISKEHDLNFGELKWLVEKENIFHNFKNEIELCFRFWKPYKYKVIIDSVKKVIKFGVRDFNDQSDLFLEIININKQIQNEIDRSVGYISFLPVEKEREKILIGFYNEENQIGDYILDKIKKIHSGYSLFIKTQTKIYLWYEKSYFEFNLSDYEGFLNNTNLNLFFNKFYYTIFLPKVKKVRLV